MNRHLETNGNLIYVSYDKSAVCRGEAWDHLVQHPPDGVKLPNVPMHVLNPYRKNHTDTQWRWRVLSPEEIAIRLEEVPEEEELRVFDPKIWKSVSHKYRTLARLPEGMTGKQAVQWAYEENIKLFGYCDKPNECWSEEVAASDFMRCATSYPYAKHCQAELTVEEYRAFRKAGGQSA
jgi:hypothetical protein